MTTEFKETYKGELIAIAKAMQDYCITTEPAILKGKDREAVITIIDCWLAQKMEVKDDTGE